MHRWLPLSIAGILFIASSTFAQGTGDTVSRPRTPRVPDLSTERPGQSLAPSILPMGMVQVEAGISYQDARTAVGAGSVVTSTTKLPSFLVRIGMFRLAEVRVESAYQVVSTSSVTGGSSSEASGFDALVVGTKLFIGRGEDAIPESAIVTNLRLPVGSEDFAPLNLAPEFILALRHTFSRTVSLSYNVGGRWDGNSPNGQGFYSVSLGLSYARRNLSGFIEGYGMLQSGRQQIHALDAGVAWQVTPDLQLDFYGGLGLSEAAPDNLVAAGVAWRFGRAR